MEAAVWLKLVSVGTSFLALVMWMQTFEPLEEKQGKAKLCYNFRQNPKISIK